MQSQAFIDFLVYFQGVRDYFQCHEVLEDEWLKDPPGERKSYLKGFIAIAVSQYHHRRGNFRGAKRAMENAVKRLKDDHSVIQSFGLQADVLMDQLREKIREIRSGKPYKSINFPIKDSELIQICQKLSRRKGCVFGNPSDMSDEQLIHKHQLPNRDKIISKREKAYRRKKRWKQDKED